MREVAYGNHGYITIESAADAGVPAVELPKLAARGGLTRTGHGVYRVTDIPSAADDQFAEATLLVGRDAYLRGDAVLALLGLADVNPTTITVGTAHRVRRAVPDYITITTAPIDAVVTRYRGIRAQPVAEAILECLGAVPGSRLRDAAGRARAEGLLTSAEWNRVRKELNR